MVATIAFYGGVDHSLDVTSSGIGYYGTAFGVSIPVGDRNSRTYITNSAGSVQGAECNNVKYVSPASAILGQTGSPILLTQIPNAQATLNPRFTYDSPVKTMSAELRAYDRSNINNGPTGITFSVAEIIHTGVTTANTGSGDATWINASGSGSVVTLAASPGTSGLSPSGSDTVDTRHDWYIACSASPDSIGSKLFAVYVSLEYL